MTRIIDEGNKNKERRNYKFFDQNQKQIDFFSHHNITYPKDLPAKNLSIPDGFEIAGLASQNN